MALSPQTGCFSCGNRDSVHTFSIHSSCYNRSKTLTQIFLHQWKMSFFLRIRKGVYTFSMHFPHCNRSKGAAQNMKVLGPQPRICSMQCPANFNAKVARISKFYYILSKSMKRIKRFFIRAEHDKNKADNSAIGAEQQMLNVI